MKKSKKKNNRRNTTSYYTPGRNMFGEKAETYLIILKRETALQQMLECSSQLDGSSTKEFTYDASCFIGHREELREVLAKVEAFLEFKAMLRNQIFESYNLNRIA